MPKKQSEWAHVPLGRILEPVSSKNFSYLRDFITQLSNQNIITIKINSLKYIHEKRWYMEEKDLLLEKKLN